MMSLPTPPIVQAVRLGERGILRGSRVKTLIDLSTTGPSVAKVVARGRRRARRRVGRLAGQRRRGRCHEGDAGGDGVVRRRPTFPSVDPLLKTFGKTFYVGDKPGLAQIAKLANNLLAAAALVVSSEAMAMGVKAGLDAKVLIDIINAGSGRNSATQDKFPRSILPGTFDFGFATGPVVQGRPAVRGRSRGARRADGRRRRRAADAGGHQREVRRRLRLHLHREGAGRVGGCRDRGDGRSVEDGSGHETRFK